MGVWGRGRVVNLLSRRAPVSNAAECGGSLVAIPSRMQGLSQIRKIAKDCRDRAARTEVAAERELLNELARHWEAVAEIREQLQQLHNRRL